MNYGSKFEVPVCKPKEKYGTAISLFFESFRDNLEIQDDNPFENSFLFHPTGSRYICNPPVLDTDEDWICHVVANTDKPNIDRNGLIEQALVDAGFELSVAQRQYPDCMSYRNGEFNIIVVYDRDFYNAWVRATEVCKYLNLQKKEDRKMVHQHICGG